MSTIEAAPIRVIKFFTEYHPSKTEPGKLAAVDMVEYCARQADPTRSSTKAKVANIIGRLQPLDPGSNNLAIQAAHVRAAAIKPLYDDWKQGNETPAHGTPLAAWPGISPEQAAILRGLGIRTVEEVRDMSEAVMVRVAFPGIREMRVQADRFLSASDQSKVAAELVKRDREIDALKAQLDELKDMVRGSRLPKTEDEAPKRRGRPPKVEQEVEAA